MRKRIGAAALCIVLAAGLVMPVGAEASEGESVSESYGETQSVTVGYIEPASYILTIPKDQSVKLGAVDTQIGDLAVTGNIGPAQQVSVTVTKTDFVSGENKEDGFAFQLLSNGQDFTSAVWDWTQTKAGDAVAYPLTVHIPVETWGGTSMGSYRATLTFTAQLQDKQ